MYFKKNWGGMAEKRPPLGRIDIFKQALTDGNFGKGFSMWISV